jgi:hypothetical protein
MAALVGRTEIPLDEMLDIARLLEHRPGITAQTHMNHARQLIGMTEVHDGVHRRTHGHEHMLLTHPGQIANLGLADGGRSQQLVIPGQE